MALPKEKFILFVRNFIFGVEDSLVSTVGLLSGVAAGGVSRSNIIIAGIVLIFVEAFSMAVGSFVSERSAEEYLDEGPLSHHTTIASLIMFVSYFIAGLIPLLPYLLTTVNIAFWVSIILSLIALFLLGVTTAVVLRTRRLRSGLRMLILGGIAIALGTAVGTIVK